MNFIVQRFLLKADQTHLGYGNAAERSNRCANTT